MLKTNSKEVKQRVREYILTALSNLDDYDNDADRLNDFFRVCETVGKIRYTSGNYGMLPFTKAIAEAVNGCYAGFDFESEEITNTVAGWTDTRPEDYSTEKTEALYYNLIARESEALAKIYNVQSYRYYLK